MSLAGLSAWDAGALTLLVCGGVLYAIGDWRMARRRAITRAEAAAFWIGLAVLVAAASPWIDRLAAHRFSAHMLQHELFMRIGVPLLIVGRPIVRWLWALPTVARGRVAALLQFDSMGRVWQTLTMPLVAWILHGATLWLWHTPALYEVAVRHEGIHALQHATFIGTSVFFWWGLVYGRYGRAAYGASMLFVFTTMMHTGALGAMFALSETPFYGVYRERAGAAGVDALTDQHLAGVYMWVPSGLILTVFGLALLVAWLAEGDRRARPAPLRTIRRIV